VTASNQPSTANRRLGRSQAGEQRGRTKSECKKRKKEKKRKEKKKKEKKNREKKRNETPRKFRETKQAERVRTRHSEPRGGSRSSGSNGRARSAPRRRCSLTPFRLRPVGGGGNHFSLGQKPYPTRARKVVGGRESYRGSCSAGSGAPNRLLLADDDGTGSAWIEPGCCWWRWWWCCCCCCCGCC